MEAQEKEEILTDPRSGRTTLLAVLSDMTEDFAARIPAPGEWSVLECVEHLAVSEDYLLSQINVSQHSLKGLPCTNHPTRRLALSSYLLWGSLSP
jgi:hypothetical protein